MYCSDKVGCGCKGEDGICYKMGSCKHEISYAEYHKLSKEESKAIDNLKKIPFEWL